MKIIKHRVKDRLGIYKRTRKEMEEPDIDITIEEIHKKIAKEKEQQREPANPGDEEDGGQRTPGAGGYSRAGTGRPGSRPISSS